MFKLSTDEPFLEKASLADAVISSISFTYWRVFWIYQKERICEGTGNLVCGVVHRKRCGQAILVGWDFTHRLTALRAESPAVKSGSRGFGSCLQN